MQSMAPADGETVEVVEGVYLTQLAVGEQMSVQHFHIEPGGRVPVHSHPHEQAGYVVHGTVTFYIDGDERSDDRDGAEHVISPGESYVIPGETPHTAENRADIPVDGIDVFSPPGSTPTGRTN
jgi:quercetin dioxygenase-like cupin family protein